MYQSLHTTVIGDQGIPFEVQIRTYDMHAIAEYGVAAHWKYKQGINKQGGEQTYEWIRRLLENQEDADAEDFIHSLKIDMFADEVFVFTPRGDVINLPAGATPIDFAYSIHSAIGNTMVGAKVNGRMVGFDCVLHNGDIVEINTSKSAHGPSRDWVKIAKSSEARSKIRQWFKKERKEENIAQGRSSFEAELKHAGLTMNQITPPDVLPAILKRVGFQSLDEMYAAIGYGGYTALKAVNRIRDELIHMSKAAAVEKAAAEAAAAAKAAKEASEAKAAMPKRVKSEKGIVVEGLSNCLVKFSKCCTPVPGDEIVGFITRATASASTVRTAPNADPSRRNAARRAAGSRSPGATTSRSPMPPPWRWSVRTGPTCWWIFPPSSAPARSMSPASMFTPPLMALPFLYHHQCHRRQTAGAGHAQAPPDFQRHEGQPSGRLMPGKEYKP